MNIFGIGNDIIEIDRIKKAVIKNERFLEKIMTKKEIKYIGQKKNPYPSCAGRFAGKEAFYKALGTGIRKYGLRDIEIENDKNGKPYINILNINLKKECDEKNIKFFITISHSRYNAIATVLAVLDI